VHASVIRPRALEADHYPAIRIPTYAVEAGLALNGVSALNNRSAPRGDSFDAHQSSERHFAL